MKLMVLLENKIALSLVSVLCILLCVNCTTTKVLKNNPIYKYALDPANPSGTRYRVNNKIEVNKVEEVDGKLKITFNTYPGAPDFDSPNPYPTITNDSITGRGITDTRPLVFYFLNEPLDPATLPNNLRKKGKFVYFTRTLGIQTLSIPIKFRTRQEKTNPLPPNVETSLNFGLAIAQKHTWNIFKTKANFLNKKITQYSLSWGLGTGLGTADLDPSTNAPGLMSKRKSATLSYGVFGMLGLNNIHFGYAFGFDKALGAGGSRWTYQDVLWHGIVVSLDVIKF